MLDVYYKYINIFNSKEKIIMATKKYVSLEKLGLYDQKIKDVISAGDEAALDSAKEYAKNYADGLASNYDVAGSAATAKSEAIAAAEGKVNELANGQVKTNKESIEAIKDGTTIDSFADVESALDGKQDKGDYATKSEAQGYANAKDEAIAAAKAAGDAAQDTADANALAINAINNETTGILAVAKGYTDDEVEKVQTAVDGLSEKVGTVPAGSTVMGIITNIQENAYDDTEITNTINGIGEKVDVLIGSDANKSVRTIANEELAKQLIPEGAIESLDTLQEIALWIQEHPGDASEMNEAIVKLQNKLNGIADGESTVKKYVDDAIAALKIGDYAKAADLTTLAGRVEALETASATHATKGELKEVSDSLTEYKNGHASDYTNTQIDNAISGAISTERALIDAELDKKVDKVEGKSLVFDTEIAKLAGVSTGANKVEASSNGKIKIDGVDTVVYTHPTSHTASEISDFATEVAKVKVNAAVAADTATKATQDGNGKNIAETYAEKATTLAGYGINNAYTKGETDKAISDAIGQFVEVSEQEILDLFA